MRIFLALVLLATPAVGFADEASRAGVVTTLQGTANVARTAIPQPAPLKFRDDVFLNDRISTGEKSVARILLGGRSIVTARERSILTITEVPGVSTVDVGNGGIAMAVAKERLKKGDVLQIRTLNAVAAVRGTVVVGEVSIAPGGAVTSTFTVLRGLVEVTRLDPASRRPVGAPISVNVLERLTIAPTPPPTPPAPQKITQETARRVEAGFKVSVRDAPFNTSAITKDQVEKALKPPDTGGRGGLGPQPGAPAFGGSPGAGAADPAGAPKEVKPTLSGPPPSPPRDLPRDLPKDKGLKK